jgi:transposase
VADRWHLLKNATEVLERTISRNYAKLRKVLSSKENEIFFSEEEIANQIKVGEEAKTKLLQEAQNKINELTPFYLEKLKVFEMVKQLQAKGLSINQIRIQINRHFSTVAGCYRAEEFQKLKQDTGSRLLKPFIKYLKQRWEEGCQNAKQLYREIKEQGYKGSDVTVRRLTYQWKTSITQNIQFIKTAPPKLPSVKQLVWLLLKAKEKLTEEEKDIRQKVLENSNEIKQGLGLLNKFRTIVREQQADKYEEWLTDVQHKALIEFENFAKGLKRDNEAVKNALSEKWSNGQVEGQINRLKFIKRAMYGRANFDLLRARVLHQF